MNIGFSTGSLAQSDFKKAIEMQERCGANAIELSALRESEIIVLLDEMDNLNLEPFKYVSFHAPSKLTNLKEGQLIELLSVLLDKAISIVVHPDIITDFNAWRIFEDQLYIENMDKRKPIGQTASHLDYIFGKLPHASLCFDLAHAKQVDPSMLEATLIATKFNDRIKQLHISDVNSLSKHERLNLEAVLAFRKLRRYLNEDVPIIIESPIKDKLDIEIKLAKSIFYDEIFDDFMNGWQIDFDSTTGIISSFISRQKEIA
jgi:endonuclease IV